jgi:uncharacterized membrane protein
MLGAGLALLVMLSGGPVDLAGFHMGVHFVALGAMLALIGFNVVNLGVLAKAMLAQRYRFMQSRTVGWLTKKFSLETGLIVGAILLLFGLLVNAWILREWLRTGQGPMEDTVHLVFAATTIAVLGLNVVFSSFLLALLLRSDAART